MKVVKVYGALKKRLGDKGHFEFDVNTPAEALKALMANFPGLDKWLLDSEKDGVGYKVLVGEEKINNDNIEVLGLPWSEREVFSITPVIAGAGRGVRNILFGAVLIGAAIFLGPGAAGAPGFLGLQAGGAGVGVLGAQAAIAIGNIGAAMVLYGIAEILSPTPPVEGIKETERIQNYSFSGIANTAQQGTAVPIAYGRCFVGSAIISASLDTDQLL
jgi:predicted phage tail protein